MREHLLVHPHVVRLFLVIHRLHHALLLLLICQRGLLLPHLCFVLMLRFLLRNEHLPLLLDDICLLLLLLEEVLLLEQLFPLVILILESELLSCQLLEADHTVQLRTGEKEEAEAAVTSQAESLEDVQREVTAEPAAGEPEATAEPVVDVAVQRRTPAPGVSS